MAHFAWVVARRNKMTNLHSSVDSACIVWIVQCLLKIMIIMTTGIVIVSEHRNGSNTKLIKHTLIVKLVVIDIS